MFHDWDLNASEKSTGRAALTNQQSHQRMKIVVSYFNSCTYNKNKENKRVSESRKTKTQSAINMNTTPETESKALTRRTAHDEPISG